MCLYIYISIDDPLTTETSISMNHKFSVIYVVMCLYIYSIDDPLTYLRCPDKGSKATSVLYIDVSTMQQNQFCH